MTTRKLLFISALLWCFGAMAQEPVHRQATPLDINDIEPTSGYTSPTSVFANPLASAQPDNRLGYAPTQVDSLPLHLPYMDASGRVMSFGYMPFGLQGWTASSLHQGLNVSIGASVFAQFGKHAHGGAGFAQSISALYAVPLTKRLSLAVGGYLDNVYWNHNTVHDAGLTAVLGYQFDEHWEAYLYAQKSLVSSRNMPFYLYDMGAVGDKIGAAVKYNFNPSFSIQMSVERGQRPYRDLWTKSQPPYRGNGE